MNPFKEMGKVQIAPPPLSIHTRKAFHVFSSETQFFLTICPKKTYFLPTNGQIYFSNIQKYLYLTFVKVHESFNIVVDLFAFYDSDAYDHFANCAI